jgi:hypothetical protein
MKPSLIRTRTAVALVLACALTPTAAGVAVARPIDDLSLPAPQTPTDPADTGTPVVTRTPDNPPETLPLVVSGAALLIAISGAGFTAISSTRLRRTTGPRA